MPNSSITMCPCESSQIAEIGHDPVTNTLAVRFKTKKGDGSVYHYQNVDAEMFDRFQHAESIGRFFGAEIKPHVDRFPFAKIEQKKKDETADAEVRQ